MSERRFNEAEVAAIFERATEAQQTGQRDLPSGEGITLIQLQEIGKEVGIAPELVVKAALALNQGGQPSSRRFLGLTVGVGRTVDLARKLSDEEWERVVVDLRETFDARGTVRSEGSLRQWTNGNLQALLEPTATGQRIRLRTVRSQSRGLMAGGLAMMGVATTAMIAAAVSSGLGVAEVLSAFGYMAAGGAGLFGLGAIRLPGWARLRQQQMEEVAARVAAIASSPPARDQLNRVR